MRTPTVQEVRDALAPLDPRQHKLVGGMIAVMMKHPDRVRDRDWLAEQLTEVTLLAGGFEAPSGPNLVEEVRTFLSSHVDVLLNACFLLFLRVASDLAPRAASGFTFEDAMAQAMSYF